jgi:hypothetical protein
MDVVNLTWLRGLGDYWQIYAVAAAAVACLLFLSVWILVRKGRSKRGGDTSIGMSFDDLEGIRRTGLLTAEEEARIRKAISRQWLEGDSAPQTRVEDLQAEAALLLEARARQLAEPPGQETSASGAGEPSLVDLAKQGRISEDEFEQLRAIFEKKSKDRRPER